jgi:cytochrome c-type biogenesis protein CcmE
MLCAGNSQNYERTKTMVLKRRHKRIAFIILGLAGLGIAAALVLSAFQKNLVFFFSPTQVIAKEAPVNRTFRVGGLVEPGTLKRENDGLTVRFTVTDTSNSIPVVFKGIIPDLFKEGRGCVAEGRIGSDGVFYADKVLAKHDENYMPPEAGQAIDNAKHEREAAKSIVNE